MNEYIQYILNMSIVLKNISAYSIQN